MARRGGGEPGGEDLATGVACPARPGKEGRTMGLRLLLVEPMAGVAAELCPPEIATRQQLDQEFKGWESYSRSARHTLKTVLLHAEAEYWLECGYFGTKVVVARRAPRGVTRCEVAWTPHYRKVARPRRK